MNGASGTAGRTRTRSGDVRSLRNHWTRPLGALGYYWFLTFEESPELHALVQKCQGAMDFPFFDLSPVDSLHLTIDRVARTGAVSADQLESIASSAVHSCRAVPSFELSIDRLSCVPSAVALDVSPVRDVQVLRETLRAATLSACPDMELGDPKPNPPHISIAYANADGVPALNAVRAVDRANENFERSAVTVTEALLVLLRRRQHSYCWRIISRAPLLHRNE